ncbi:M28 family peptidase [Glaciecola sp. XM2]|uniref:M28 family metallopeptidase n=1 Tax=Glaciecola sp. XM2 TaxID=1914931 RepID=UPI001BDE1F41|nr:M28 family metallopeptidase [Glaciecola sp. XM2]MBT1450941.1 M28 family peptidase [Glaciecola sp. XM2]
MTIRNTLSMFAALACASTLMAGCTPATQEQTTAEAQQAQTPTEQSADNFKAVYDGISTERIKQDIITLASDEFEGRAPTTIGEVLTLAMLTDELQKAGLQPGNGDSFLQQVDLMQITASDDMTLNMGTSSFAYKENMVAGSKRETDTISVNDSPIVFLGYGVNAPEYDWNDYGQIDVKGKTVIVLVNDPGFAAPDSGLFDGSTMTYYGRWSYKYEEASRQGAEAVFIVHETAPASYGWSVVANSWSGPQYSLVSPDQGASRVAVEGWISREAAIEVFAQAGLDFDEEKQKALEGPYAKALDINASVTVKNEFEQSHSYNVFATLPGSEKPQEHIIYTAHWDHLGKDESKDGDQIYNGAHDNATGTAAILEIGRAFASLDTAPKRSISLLIVTAEEQGLLGSKYYAENPIIPLDKTVANINMDAMNILGKTKDVAVVGMGKSTMEDFLLEAATNQGRVLSQEERPEAGIYYRSDHFSFAKFGVPALYAKGGSQPIDEETANYRKRMNVIVTGCYHQVCDQYRETWNLEGITEDTQLLFEVGYDVANAEGMPQWNPSSEFQRP